MRTVSALVLALITGCIIPVAPAGTGPGPAPGPPGGDEPVAEAPPPTAYSAPTPAAAPTPAPPTTASVTLRSSCSRTVKVFYGDKPGFSSGTQSSISSNSVSSKTFRVGDRMWILDDSGKPLGDVTISASTRQIEVSSSCGSLSSR